MGTKKEKKEQEFYAKLLRLIVGICLTVGTIGLAVTAVGMAVNNEAYAIASIVFMSVSLLIFCVWAVREMVKHEKKNEE